MPAKCVLKISFAFMTINGLKYCFCANEAIVVSETECYDDL